MLGTTQYIYHNSFLKSKGFGYERHYEALCYVQTTNKSRCGPKPQITHIDTEAHCNMEILSPKKKHIKFWGNAKEGAITFPVRWRGKSCKVAIEPDPGEWVKGWPEWDPPARGNHSHKSLNSVGNNKWNIMEKGGGDTLGKREAPSSEGLFKSKI